MIESKGCCQLCKQTLNKKAMQAHLAMCAGTLAAQPLLQLHVEGAEAPEYWLDLDIVADAKLESLDLFLRRIWLECCGHLSSFSIGKFRYSSMLDDFEAPSEKTLNNQIGRVLGRTRSFEYDYDFGSTTNLVVTVTAHGTALARKDAVRLLARNIKPDFSCSHRGCNARATSICSFCVWQGKALACEKHAKRHSCGDSEGWLPLVNSPRTGVCGYTGKTELH